MRERLLARDVLAAHRLSLLHAGRKREGMEQRFRHIDSLIAVFQEPTNQAKGCLSAVRSETEAWFPARQRVSLQVAQTEDASLGDRDHRVGQPTAHVLCLGN